MIVITEEMSTKPLLVDWFLGTKVADLRLEFNHYLKKWVQPSSQFSEMEVWCPSEGGCQLVAWAEKELVELLAYQPLPDQPTGTHVTRQWIARASSSGTSVMASTRSQAEALCVAVVWNGGPRFNIPLEVLDEIAVHDKAG